MSRSLCLNAVFKPRSIAVIGAVMPGELGDELKSSIACQGFPEERIYLVDPQAERDGIYRSLTDIDDDIDLALITAPANTVPYIVDECAQADVKAVLVKSPGFEGGKNSLLEKDIIRKAEKHGIFLLGPSCTVNCAPSPAEAALIAPDGFKDDLLSQIEHEKNACFGKVVALGKSTELSVQDMLEYFAQDDDIRVLAVCVDKITDGRAFMSTLLEIAEKKTVIIHNPNHDPIYDEAMDICCAVRADSVEQIFDICRMMKAFDQVGYSEKYAAMTQASDGTVTVDEYDISFGRHSVKSIPPKNSRNFSETLDVTAKAHDFVIAELNGNARSVIEQIAKVRAKTKSNIAVICANDAALKKLPSGILRFDTTERAASAYERLYSNFVFTTLNEEAAPDICPDIPVRSNADITEPQLMRMLALSGIPVPRFRLAPTHRAAVDNARDIGFPVAMKRVGRNTFNETDAAHNIENDLGVLEAFNRFIKNAADDEFQGAMVYSQPKPGCDVHIGIARDKRFGPVITLDAGGSDLSAICPVTSENAQAMVCELLAQAKNVQNVNRELLSTMLCTLSKIQFEFPKIEKAEFNAVFYESDEALLKEACISLK